MYYLRIGKHIVLKVLNTPQHYVLKLHSAPTEGYLCLKIECADTQIFKELFPRLQPEIEHAIYGNYL